MRPPKNQPAWLNQKGISIVSVLVAIGIMAVLMSGMATMFQQMYQNKSILDKKVDMQNMNTLLRIGILNSAACAKSLDLTKTPIYVDRTCLPTAAGGACSITIPKMVVAGTDFVPAARIGQITIDTMSFDITSEPTKKNEYIGKMNVVVSTKAGNYPMSQILGGPVMLRFEDAPSDPNKVYLKECMGTSAFDPKEVCESMNGDWLEATIPQRYMPVPRCNFGTDIILGSNEAPDDVPIDGTYGVEGTMSEGKRVVECLYQSNANQKTNVWKCPAPSASLAGWRCAFDLTNKVWQVRYYSAANQPGKVWNTCNKGVKVATLDDSFDLLSYNSRMALDGDDAAPTSASKILPVDSSHDFIQQMIKIGSIKRCRIDVMTDAWYDCNKADGVAMEAKAGSCIFVNNMKMSAKSTAYKRITTCNTQMGKHPIAECPPSTDFTYTGWIYASTPRSDKPVGLLKSYLRTDITEATGSPCFLAEYDRGIASGSAPFIEHKNDVVPATEISPKYCVVSSNNGGATTYYHSHVCETGTRVVTSINAKGVVTGTTLKKGGCFYATASTQPLAPMKVSGFNITKGTWVYLKADIANIQNLDLGLDANKNIITLKTGKTRWNLPNAIACTEGSVELQGEEIGGGDAEAGEDVAPVAFNYNETFPLAATATDDSPDLTDPALKDFIAQMSFGSTIQTCQSDYTNTAAQLACVKDEVSINNHKVGSCVFVSNVNASASVASLTIAKTARCNLTDGCPGAVSPYTGWLRVTTARAAPTQTAAGVTTIGNTNGLICYTAAHEYSKEMSETGMLKYVSSAPTALLQPKYCILQDNVNKARFAAIPCQSNDIVLDRLYAGSQEIPVNSCWHVDPAVKINATANVGSWALVTAQTDFKTGDIAVPPLSAEGEVQDLNLKEGADAAKVSNIAAKRCIGVVY